MDFRLSAEEIAFQQEVREWVLANLPDNWDQRSEDPIAGDITDWPENDRGRKKLADKGWLALAWPKQYGGLGASHMQQALFNWEMAYWRFPGNVGSGISFIGPSIMIHGTAEQKDRYLPRIASAEDVWCQLFTEPGAGSDLASLQTRAVEDGDVFVINGQKIFTSGAHHAKYGWAGLRTDPNAPKHRGVSVMVVPMDTPGITIRPLINMAGQHAQNEVFFDDVRIPRENMIGEKNRGWYYMMTTLDFERSGVGGYATKQRGLEELVQYAKDTRYNGQTLAQEPSVRNRLAQMAIELEMGKWIAMNIVWMQSRGIVPNREASISKVWGAEASQRLANAGLQIMGLYGQLRRGSKHAPLTGRIEYNYRGTVVNSIGGGSSEINRGIIATRGLGLPR